MDFCCHPVRAEDIWNGVGHPKQGGHFGGFGREQRGVGDSGIQLLLILPLSLKGAGDQWLSSSLQYQSQGGGEAGLILNL